MCSPYFGVEVVGISCSWLPSDRDLTVGFASDSGVWVRQAEARGSFIGQAAHGYASC